MFTAITLISNEITALKSVKLAPFLERARDEQVKRLEKLLDQLCLDC